MFRTCDEYACCYSHVELCSALPAGGHGAKALYLANVPQQEAMDMAFQLVARVEVETEIDPGEPLPPSTLFL